RKNSSAIFPHPYGPRAKNRHRPLQQNKREGPFPVRDDEADDNHGMGRGGGRASVLRKEECQMATNNSAKGQVVDVTKQLIVGATKHLAAGTTVSFDGSSYTPDQITQKLQALVNLRSNVAAA